jgi:hypothetical protein
MGRRRTRARNSAAPRRRCETETNLIDVTGKELMHLMHSPAMVGALLAVAGFGTGIVAAVLWLRASRFCPVPVWAISGKIEPVDPYAKADGWLYGLMQAAETSGRLNARAARWTAASVTFSASSALVGAWPAWAWWWN